MIRIPWRLLRAAYRVTLGERPTLVGVLLALTLTLTLAFISNFWLPFRIGYVLLFALVAGVLWTWLHTQGLRVHRDLTKTRLTAGDSLLERIEIANRLRFPKLWLEVQSVSDLPGEHGGRVVSLGSRAKQSWEVATECGRRGLYTLGPVTVRVSDPFDLFHWERRFGRKQEILVYPRTLELPGYGMPPANLPGEGRYRRRTHYVTPNASGVREYQAGDSFNRIHWPSTVRTGQLMVKTFELDPASHVWVVLDMDERVQAGSGDESTTEYAVTIAASLVQHFLAQSRAVGLLTFTDGLRTVEPNRGGHQLTQMLELLAIAQPVGDVRLGSLLLQQGHQWGRHTTLIAVTSSVERGWAEALRALRLRGVRTAATLVDAESFGGLAGAAALQNELLSGDIPATRVQRGDYIPTAMSHASAGVSVRAVS